MVTYLLDTCIPIMVFRGNEEPIHWLSNIPADQIKISSITVMELQAGIEYASANMEKKKQQLKKFLDLYETINFKTDDAIQTAKIIADLKKQGQMIGPYDLQIAGIVLNYQFTLVSYNLKEFSRVKKLNVITCAND
jgi:tRNA(fMet)-specific endonuclease VapC